MYDTVRVAYAQTSFRFPISHSYVQNDYSYSYAKPSKNKKEDLQKRKIKNTKSINWETNESQSANYTIKEQEKETWYFSSHFPLYHELLYQQTFSSETKASYQSCSYGKNSGLKNVLFYSFKLFFCQHFLVEVVVVFFAFVIEVETEQK